MEVKNFVFNVPQTCFNVGTGRKIADNILAVSLFRNQWTYGVFADNSAILWDDKGKEISKTTRLKMADGKFFVVENEDGTQSLINAFGCILFDRVEKVELLDNGWFVIRQNDKNALYRGDLSFVLDGFLRVKLTEAQTFVLAQYQTDLWTVFRCDGTFVADNVIDFQFISATFYCLKFADKNMVFDEEKHSQVVCNGKSLCLLKGNTFKALVDGQMVLYRTNGSKLLSGYQDYIATCNGLFLARRDDFSYVLFDADFQIINERVVSVTAVDYNDFLLVSNENGYYLYNACGKLIRKADYLEICGCGYFLEKQKNQQNGVLLNADMIEVERDVFFAEVYPNGWLSIYKFDNGIYELRNQDGVCVATSHFEIEYVHEYKVWIVCQDDFKCALWHENLGCIVCDVDKIVLFDALAIVKSQDACKIYSLTLLNDASSNVDAAEQMQPIWASSLSMTDLLEKVAFCSEGYSANSQEFYLLARNFSEDAKTNGIHSCVAKKLC